MDVVLAHAVVQGGKPYAILVQRDGTRSRASLPDLTPAPPSAADFQASSRAAKPGTAIASQGLIGAGDAYHYAHHSTPAVLPAWRTIYADAPATRLYFDTRTAELVGFVDDGSRGFRWWHLGLHRLDIPGLRERPWWDLVTLPLLTGVALVCLLGAWMSARRLTRPRRKSV